MIFGKGDKPIPPSALPTLKRKVGYNLKDEETNFGAREEERNEKREKMEVDQPKEGWTYFTQ